MLTILELESDTETEIIIAESLEDARSKALEMGLVDLWGELQSVKSEEPRDLLLSSEKYRIRFR